MRIITYTHADQWVKHETRRRLGGIARIIGSEIAHSPFTYHQCHITDRRTHSYLDIVDLGVERLEETDRLSSGPVSKPLNL